MLNKKVLVRGEASGVFYGTLSRKDGREVQITDCRRIWQWVGANSLSQLAIDGTARPNSCRFPEAVSEITILDAIEIIVCTPKACKSIESVPVWRL